MNFRKKSHPFYLKKRILFSIQRRPPTYVQRPLVIAPRPPTNGCTFPCVQGSLSKAWLTDLFVLLVRSNPGRAPKMLRNSLECFIRHFTLLTRALMLGRKVRRNV